MPIIHETPDNLAHHHLRSKDGLQKVYAWILSRKTKGPHHVLLLRHFSHFRLSDVIWRNVQKDDVDLTEFSKDGSDVIAYRAGVVENWLKKHRCYVREVYTGSTIIKELDGTFSVSKVPMTVADAQITCMSAGSLVYYDDDPFDPAVGESLDKLRELLNAKKRVDVILSTYLPRNKGVSK